MCVGMCSCVWIPEVDIGVHLDHPLTYILRFSICHLNPRSPGSGGLASQLARNPVYLLGTEYPGFQLGARGLSSDPHICRASTFAIPLGPHGDFHHLDLD